MSQIGMEKQYQEAMRVYQLPECKTLVDAALEDIANRLESVLSENRDQMRKALVDGSTTLEPLRYAYHMFHTHDVVTLPFLEGSEAREYAEIEVYRVSPADTDGLKPSYMNNGTPKLAGPAFAAFGGFMQKSWREHDMMWGRLDGAERIITALLPAATQKVLRDGYIGRAQDIILNEEFSLSGAGGKDRVFSWLAHTLREENVTDRSADELVRRGQVLLEKFPMLAELVAKKDFRTFLERYYARPPQPLPDKMANWAARSFKILGKMFDDLPDGNLSGVEKRTAGIFRSSGVLLTNLLRFATPESLWRKLANHWLSLIALAAVVMAIVGPFVAAEGIAMVGYATLLICLGAWILLPSFGAWLKNRSPLREPAFALSLAIIFGLAVFGAFTLWDLVRTWTLGDSV